jgi:hypothetical protein
LRYGSRGGGPAECSQISARQGSMDVTEDTIVRDAVLSCGALICFGGAYAPRLAWLACGCGLLCYIFTRAVGG